MILDENGRELFVGDKVRGRVLQDVMEIVGLEPVINRITVKREDGTVLRISTPENLQKISGVKDFLGIEVTEGDQVIVTGVSHLIIQSMNPLTIAKVTKLSPPGIWAELENGETFYFGAGSFLVVTDRNGHVSRAPQNTQEPEWLRSEKDKKSIKYWESL